MKLLIHFYSFLRSFGFVLSTCVVTSGVSAGGISYPALGNVHLEEGTIELWLIPDIDPEPDLGDKKFMRVFPLFSLASSGNFSLIGNWVGKVEGKGNVVFGPQISLNSERKNDTLLSIPALNSDQGIAPGVPLHVAMTWNDTDMRVWVNGRESGRRLQLLGFSGSLGGECLRIGHVSGSDAPIRLIAIRVSSGARTDQQMLNAKPTAETGTLLLDRFTKFEKRDGKSFVIPEIISSPQTLGAGLIVGEFEPLAGGGVALHQIEDSLSNAVPKK